MPEIAEVARVVHFLQKHLLGKTIRIVTAVNDPIVLKSDVKAELTHRKVLEIGRHGKYFWLSLNSKKCVVMHLGMTGWVHIQGDKTAPDSWYKRMKTGTDWPPKFWKFHFETKENTPVRIAYTNSRRIGQVIVVDGDSDSIRTKPPLDKLGLDPITDVVSVEWLQTQLAKRRCPIKAFLLDQSVLCGIGNWVADEVLYHARIHPKELCCNITEEVFVRLHRTIMFVCRLAIDKLADESLFPENWLFKHRWTRGKHGPGPLPNGEPLALVTVGGRTSCFAPNCQLLMGDHDYKSTKNVTQAKAKKTDEKIQDEEPKAEVGPNDQSGAITNEGKPAKISSRRKRPLIQDESEDKTDRLSLPRHRTRSSTKTLASNYFE